MSANHPERDMKASSWPFAQRKRKKSSPTRNGFVNFRAHPWPTDVGSQVEPPKLRGSEEVSTVQDIIYLLVTLGFFGLMWLFVIGCDAIIGRDDELTPLSATTTMDQPTAAPTSRS